MKKLLIVLCMITTLVSSTALAAEYTAKENYLISPSGLPVAYLIPQTFSSMKTAKKYIKKVEYLDEVPSARKLKGLKVMHGDHYVYFICKADTRYIIFRSEWNVRISNADIAAMKKVTFKEDDKDEDKICLVTATD